MLYMLTCLVIMVYVMYLMVTTLKDKLENLDDSRVFRPGALTTFATIGAVILLLSPLYMTMVSDSLSQNASLFTQWAGLAGGLLLVGVYGWLFLKRRTPASCVLSLCGALLAFMYLNSLFFVSSDNTGVLNFAYLNSIAEIKSVQCDAGILVVKLADKGEPTEWRCPEYFAFMGNTSKPFLPWPSYTKGQSVELTTVLHTMIDSAAKSP
ncbi:hypothetical protein [Klebsiella pneumoniae]|uniref:hypothetical protein n=1 Tax=Klebsiella pneumoniae TaxID=573 RepID=UPI000E2A5DC4|nr:hypothetical protein [Klebsiella pneumoniae]SYF74472.1 Uncharacterised protein [Klebsiella pneumoniae]